MSAADPDAEFAPAKINLYLHITGRQGDGYHLLDSLAVFPDIGDRVIARPAPTLSLELAGPFAGDLGAGEDNLVLAAARALAASGGGVPGVVPGGVPEGVPGAALRLEKNLPVASGIGGGSADAAATLRLLARLWAREGGARERGARERADLPAIAARLGADVPVCLGARAARMSGIGIDLAPPPRLPEAGIVLANPGIALPTRDVFAARGGAFSAPPALPAGWEDAAAMAADLAALGNDLEAPAIALRPQIGTVLAALRALPGVLLARMSGSGATCFAVFATAEAALAASRRLPREWWVKAGVLPATGSRV